MDFIDEYDEDEDIPEYVPRTPDDDYYDEIHNRAMDRAIHASIGRLAKLTADSTYYRISLHGICSSMPLSKRYVDVRMLFNLLNCIFYSLPPYGPTLDILDDVPSDYDKDPRFVKDHGKFFFVKASSQEEAKRKEQAIKEWLIKLDEMLEVFGAEFFTDGELELRLIQKNREQQGNDTSR